MQSQWKTGTPPLDKYNPKDQPWFIFEFAEGDRFCIVEYNIEGFMHIERDPPIGAGGGLISDKPIRYCQIPRLDHNHHIGDQPMQPFTKEDISFEK